MTADAIAPPAPLSSDERAHAAMVRDIARISVDASAAQHAEIVRLRAELAAVHAEIAAIRARPARRRGRR